MPISKVRFNNKANTTVRVPAAGLGFKTRTIYNSSIEFGETVNWKLDLYRSNNMSYAQVLKTAVKHKAADARIDASINIKAANVTANNESVTGTHMHRTVNKVYTGCNYKYEGHKIKAKCSKGQSEVIHQQSEKNDIQCKNRFAPLSVEEVICDMDSARAKYVICTSKPLKICPSPMMTREKPNAPHRRVIIDLSFPQGKSVNAGIPKDQYLGTPFILKLPTVDTITDQIKVLGRGCKLYKVDISRAFRHVKLDPKEYDLLGLHHERYYVDTCLPFGYRNGSALFQRLSNTVHHIMCQRHYDVINYIDDILGIGLPSQIDTSFDALRQILRELGLQISDKKLESPTTCLNCLDRLINTETFTMSMPPQKYGTNAASGNKNAIAIKDNCNLS